MQILAGSAKLSANIAALFASGGLDSRTSGKTAVLQILKVGVIRDYAEHYDNFTDENADRAANSILDFEAKRVAVKRKYYERMKNALSAKTAARYFQVENQILMLLDLQVSSMLPAMK